MDPQRLPDWRIHRAVEVAADSTLPGGETVKAGDLAIVVAETMSSQHGPVMIPVVSPYSLALSIAIRASHAAQAIWRRVKFEHLPSTGKFKFIQQGNSPSLFDYFEQSMISATFSFQALEAFANQVMEDRLGGGQTYTVTRKKGPQTLDSASLQRELSTEEKLATVLPDLFKVISPKGKKIWQRFVGLKRVRDATVHLKTADHYVVGSVDKQTLFYQLLNHNAREFPRVSIDLMTYYNAGQQPTWLAYAQEQLEQPEPEPNST